MKEASVLLSLQTGRRRVATNGTVPQAVQSAAVQQVQRFGILPTRCLSALASWPCARMAHGAH
eukprot:362822-Chlamydomonas_euryale.AAC.27